MDESEYEKVSESQKDKIVLDLPAAAEYLCISTAFLYKLVENKSIPFCKVGKKRVLFRKPDLFAWLGSLVVNPANEIGNLDE